MKKFDFIATDKFAIGIAFDMRSWIFGIDIEFNLPGVLIQVGIGPFYLYITW